MSVIGAVYFVYLSIRLRLSFPGLQDPSSEADGYWPQLFHDLYLVFAAFLGFVSVVLFLLSNFLRRRHKRLHETNTLPKID